MASKRPAPPTLEAPPFDYVDEDDLKPYAQQPAPPKPAQATGTPTSGESVHAVEEEMGQVSPDGLVGGEEAGLDERLHEEVSAEGAEAADEYFEASAEQLEAGPSAEDDAASDLKPMPGYGQESAGEAVGGGLMPDAGAEAYGSQEFLPIVGAVAANVLPLLASKAGPALARKVMGRLEPRAKSLLKRVPRGSGLLSTIARLLESAEDGPAGESDAESVDPTLVESTVQLLEVIIGTDDRVRITLTRNVPWRRICALRIHMPSGAIYRGTGFLIGPRTVVTAGHCVYLHNQGGWARRIEVIPGSNGAQRPFGSAVSSRFRSVKGWVSDRKPHADYGAILLPQNSFGAQNLGSFGFAAFPSPLLLAKRAVVAGYPGDKPFAELWGMSRRLKAVTSQQLIYEIDTMGGQSGAPVYVKHGGKRYVVGIHNYGALSGNSATRITLPVFANLKKWKAL